MTDRQHHTPAQAEELAARTRQLAAALTERDELRAELDTTRNTLHTTAAKLARQAAVNEQALAYRKELEATITSKNAELHRADLDAKTVEQRQAAAAQEIADLTAQLAERELRITLGTGIMLAQAVLCLILALALLFLT
ncbi:hypothetical protein [Nocardia tenerifensis]|uniref:hypothetical protein n=1 Tax=Nocardia tenerifensis TaxID=228006 RepID=UPI00031DD6B1|nr:hypothetical protein [Nocardia tenerifensis]